MPAATPIPQRLLIQTLQQDGLAPRQIAQQLSLPVRTVRDLLARWRSRPADHDLAPDPPRGGRHLDPARQAVRDACLHLRQQHEGWGGGRIRLELLRRGDGSPIPPTRTLQRWLRQAGLNVPPLQRQTMENDRRAQGPHEVWQMDAVEGLRLVDGSGACWLRQTDECSGAIVATEVFPPLPLVHGPGGPCPRSPAAVL